MPHTSRLSIEEVAVHVTALLESGMTCCVIGAPGHDAMVQGRVEQMALARRFLAGHRKGEVSLVTEGVAKFLANNKSWARIATQVGRLPQARLQACVIVSEDEDGRWESTSYDDWRRREMVKPQRIWWYRLRDPWL